jgi:hypothetical protein
LLLRIATTLIANSGPRDQGGNLARAPDRSRAGPLSASHRDSIIAAGLLVTTCPNFVADLVTRSDAVQRREQCGFA